LKKVAENKPTHELLVEVSIELHKLKEALKSNEKYEDLNSRTFNDVERREHKEEQEELNSKITQKTRELKNLVNKLGR
jgi:hypothetical protein